VRQWAAIELKADSKSMLNFLPGSGVFFLAGLVAAAGPVIIHLLNRRRFRVVNWAAMDFLLEALQRNRRMLHLRDLLLLALRTACILLFGLALARPYFSSSDATVSPNQPLHAILLVDNSLSMGYENLQGNVLDEARAKAKEFIEELPEGSAISVLPVCGNPGGYNHGAYATKEEARDALDKIRVVDRAGSASSAADQAREAREQMPELPTKRVVFLGDQQLINWPADSLASQLADLPEMQVVSIAPPETENTWVEDFSVQDGLADVETPTVFTAHIRHEGSRPRSAVQVTLSIDGAEVGSETVDLDPDQSREVSFTYRFEVPAEPGKPMFVPAKVSIPPDHLKEDDARYLSVPVVAALPVVFIDQYGADEDPKKNRYGETRHLRRLLAPVTARGEVAKQLVKIKHLKIDELLAASSEEARSILKDARLVVIAGVANPEGAVPVLREYVKQGGQLLIAAGADFDPALWNQHAWLAGSGILPLPLKGQPVGKTPEESPGELKPFFISFPSLVTDYFHLANTSDEDLRDLYGASVFFKAVEVERDDSVLSTLMAAETVRIEHDRQALASTTEHLKSWSEKEAKGALTKDDAAARDKEEQTRLGIEPNWLNWSSQRAISHKDQKPAELAAQARPRVLASFDNKLPFLVERTIGQGQVLFASTGVFSDWNNLGNRNTILLFDRILRGMLEQTLPPRTVSTAATVTVPVSDRNAMYTLTRPDGSQERLDVDPLGSDAYSVTVKEAADRGIYHLAAAKGDQSAETEGAESKLWEVPLAVNGPSRESQLVQLDEAGLQARMGKANYRWIGRGQPISLEGAQVRGQDLWKWLIFLVLVCLLAELAVLARPALARER